MQSQPITISPEQSNFLKGIAIGAVILIHFLASLPHVYTTSQFPLFFISIDQLSRFCVPLFLFLSAYGLSKKYAKTPLLGKSYFFSRLGKLIPLYLLWSIFSIVFFLFISEWRYVNQPTSIAALLFLGQADYQLYFLPLIFQLYVLFPLLRSFVKKYPLLTLVVALSIQALWYLYISGYIANVPPQLEIDRYAYVMFVSWIGYFVGGIFFAQVPVSTRLRRVVPLALIIGALGVILSSWSAINHGIDPLIALRFTRLPMFFFATCVCLFSGTHLAEVSEHWGVVRSVFNWMGKNSYLLFLAHTLGLRFLFASQLPEISPLKMVIAILSWVAMVILTRKMLAR